MDALAEALQHECPLRISGPLHARGFYVHCTRPQFPGKVLCFHKDTERPADCTPTDAQAALFVADAGKVAGFISPGPGY